MRTEDGQRSRGAVRPLVVIENKQIKILAERGLMPHEIIGPSIDRAKELIHINYKSGSLTCMHRTLATGLTRH